MKPNMAPENDPMVQELKRLNDIQEAQLKTQVINDFGWYGIMAVMGRDIRQNGTHSQSFWIILILGLFVATFFLVV